jgi:diacylglycerol kinase family enzyme
VTRALFESGFDAEPYPSRSAGDATFQARRAALEGVEVVFAMGGDGTLRECAAGLLGSQPALGFLPSGTINVMALELAVPAGPAKAARAYSNATCRDFGVGLAGKAPFLMQVSAGVDAFLIGALRPAEKKLLGKASSVPAIVRSLLGYSFPAFEVTSPSGTRSVTLAVASNVRRYGGPWRLTPDARSDGKGLELFCFSGRGRVAVIRLALALLTGRHLGLPGSSIERVGSASFTPVPALPFQIDGDVLERPVKGPLEVGLSERGIRVLVPQR